jgi:hypothetical protein
MTLGDFQIWLMDQGIRDDLDEVTRRTVVTELDNLVPAPEDAPAAAID